MGTGPSREESAQAAEVEQKRLEEEQRRQEEQTRLRESLLAAERAQRAENSKHLIESYVADGQEQCERNQVFLEDRKTARKEELEREAEIASENNKKLLDNLERNHLLLNEARDRNQEEKVGTIVDHKEKIDKVSEEMNKTLEENSKKVIELKKEAKEEHLKLQNDKQSHAKQQLNELKEHHKRVRNLEKKKAKIGLEGVENEKEHKENLAAMRELFALEQYNIGFAKESDRTEIGFLDAVENARKSGNCSSINTSFLNKIKTRIELKVKIGEKVVNECRAGCTGTINNLHVLMSNAESILNQPEKNNPNVLECQSVAREIQKNAKEVAMQITDVQIFMDDDMLPDCVPQLLEAIGKLENLKKILQDTMDNLPSVHGNDHTLKAFTKAVNSVKISFTSNQPSISNV